MSSLHKKGTMVRVDRNLVTLVVTVWFSDGKVLAFLTSHEQFGILFALVYGKIPVHIEGMGAQVVVGKKPDGDGWIQTGEATWVMSTFNAEPIPEDEIEEEEIVASVEGAEDMDDHTLRMACRKKVRALAYSEEDDID